MVTRRRASLATEIALIRIVRVRPTPTLKACFVIRQLRRSLPRKMEILAKERIAQRDLFA